jgi:hypothetical protein
VVVELGFPLLPSDDTRNFTVDIVNNSNISEIENKRYSYIEIEADNLNFTQPTNGVA